MDPIEHITNALVKFRDERNWQQFHNPKDLAMALSIEAAELNELFLLKKGEKEWNDVPLEELKEELADVFAFAFLLANKFDLDVKDIVLDKIRKNGQKYPVDKSYNSAAKYNRLE
ncbi:MAG: nucleotide pyrophosphohydrolase [Bacteroidales bacterium]|nr:nucleotide pyrophosphohydrolase [Bacteroidales bacterium]